MFAALALARTRLAHCCSARSRALALVPLLLSPIALAAPALGGGGIGGRPTGGNGGTFDWVVPANSTFFLDTAGSTILGGPGGAPTTAQLVDDGVVQVRDFILEAGATVRVQGPFPLQILATGDIRIEGTLDVSGFDAKDVLTLNTANLPEPGGSGGPGGGRLRLPRRPGNDDRHRDPILEL